MLYIDPLSSNWTKLYMPGRASDYPALEKLIAGTLNIKHLRSHWNEILRFGIGVTRVLAH
jgi:hypothetical protein